MKNMTPTAKGPGQALKTHSKVRFRETLVGYLFMLPLIVGLLVFTLYPMLDSFRLSLYGTYPQQPDTFIGLGNFDYAIRDARMKEPGTTRIMV